MLCGAVWLCRWTVVLWWAPVWLWLCDGGAVMGDGSAVMCDSSAVMGNGSAVMCDGSAVMGDGSALMGDGSAAVVYRQCCDV